jgi:hypothetical protein
MTEVEIKDSDTHLTILGQIIDAINSMDDERIELLRDTIELLKSKTPMAVAEMLTRLEAVSFLDNDEKKEILNIVMNQNKRR